MPKSGERSYFKAIGADGMGFTLHKPFSDPKNMPGLLSDIAAVITQLPLPPAKLLDLGCGSGWTSNFYAQAGYEVTGVDISKDAVEAARKHFVKPGLGLKFRHGDYDQLGDLKDFDCTVFFDSLHHSEDELDGLRAAYRALKPGGIIILCEPGVGHSKTAASVEAMQKYNVNERDMPPRLSRKGLRSAGFINIQTFAYPAITHRFLYTTRLGKMSFRNNALVRAISAGAAASLLLGKHGLVVATKPRLKGV